MSNYIDKFIGTISQVFEGNEQKKLRTIFRTSTYKLEKSLLKILFTIAGTKDSFLISQKFLSNSLNIGKTTLNYQIKKLRNKGLIDENNRLTDRGKKAIQYFNHWDQSITQKLRAHKIQISINLNRLPTNFFQIRHKILTPFTNKRYSGLKGQLFNSTILFYSTKKLIVKIPDVFGNTTSEIMSAITDCAEQLFHILTVEFPGISFHNYEICKFDSMHIAVLNSIIAETFLIKEKRNYKGANGLCIDKSHGIPELECEKLSNITDDIEVLIKYEDLMRENTKLTKLLQEYNIKT